MNRALPVRSSLATSAGAEVAAHAHMLGRHLQQCHSARGRWERVGIVAEQVHGWIAPRFVTVLALAVVALAAACA